MFRLGGSRPGGSLAGNDSSPHSSIKDSTSLRIRSSEDSASESFEGIMASVTAGDTSTTLTQAKVEGTRRIGQND